jgi:tetratricopeptide (TPR) repeat protein
VYEFVHSHRTQGWLVLESASVSYGKATPYFPVIDLLKRYVHVEDGDDARTIRAKVTGQILTLDEPLQETIAAVLSLLDALPEDSPFLQLDPPQRRQRTLNGLKRILLRESQVQPLLLVFEDLHWIDSETQALLDSLVESLPTAQLLLLANYRPEYTHNWSSKTYCTQLRLDPLPPESADAFLEALLGDGASLESLKTLLIERTEGNPFFLEESVRTLVETQVLAGELGAYRLVQDLPSIRVPPTVQAVLAARIDRLPLDEKSLLQTASVIGNEIPFTLLQAIAEMPEDTLYRGLTHLQATEFLYETSQFPERVYTFKHALTHEVAYNSLLQERRRVLHARIVETLDFLVGDQVGEQVERLAHHAMRGEVWDKALKYFRQAGDKAMEQSAYQNAVDRFEQALDALRHLPDSPDTVAQGIDVRLNMHTALYPLSEFERDLNFLREAETLAKALGDKHRLVQICDTLTIIFRGLTNYEFALEYSQRTYALARDLGDLDSQIRATLHLGQIYYDLGDYSEAIECFQENIASLQGGGLEERLSLVRCLAELGDFSEGLNFGEEALRMAEEVDRPNERAAAYARIGFLHLRQGDVLKAIALLERGLTLSQVAGLRMYFRIIRDYLAFAYALASRTAEALSLLDQTSPDESGMAIPMPNRSEAYLLSGCIKEAHQNLLANLERCQTHQARGAQAWDLRILGEIAMHRDPPETEQAETHYQQALTLATELGMRPLQAHCHRGLGTLYSQTGQAEQARTELSTAINLYRDMEMTFWLPETEAALAAVEGQA